MRTFCFTHAGASTDTYLAVDVGGSSVVCLRSAQSRPQYRPEKCVSVCVCVCVCVCVHVCM